MGIEDKTRREYLKINAIDPANGKFLEVQISFNRIQTVGKRSQGHASECAYIVPQILQKPSAIFEGLCLDADEPHRGYGWLCYCGIPTCSYTTDGQTKDPWPNEVFLVFINDEKVAYNWYWTACDDDNHDLPKDHDTRFKKRLL